MRLLHTQTYQFKWFADPLSVEYAILSHVWSKQGEQSYQDVQEIVERYDRPVEYVLPQLSEKIIRSCEYARAEGYEYIWIDSCCIDKTSSTELSEAINSMHKWYASASQCFVFLQDVEDEDNPWQDNSRFRHSLWFKRGWTLQELIAPNTLVFLTTNWISIGTKHTLAPIVEAVTGIDIGILRGTESLEVVSVARRMSWASKRSTTRIEDRAYALMGLFGIHMPTIYGEGHHAFVRLQEEILKHFPDDTLFAWGQRLPLRTPNLEFLLNVNRPPDYHGRLLAPSPRDFESATELWPITQDALMERLGMLEKTHHYPPPTYSMTRYGIQAEIPIISIPNHTQPLLSLKLGFLLCEDLANNLIALILRPSSAYGSASQSLHSAYTLDPLLVGSHVSYVGVATYCRLVAMPSAVVKHLIGKYPPTISLVHIPREGPMVRLNPRWTSQIPVHPFQHVGKCSVLMPSWHIAALAAQDVTVQKLVLDRPSLLQLGRSDSLWCPRRHLFFLTHPAGAVRVLVGFCEHCDPSDPAFSNASGLAGLRVQMQSSTTRGPATTPDSLLFQPHKESVGPHMDHVSHWRRRDGSAYMEFTPRDVGAAFPEQGLRLRITCPDSPRDLCLTLVIEFSRERT